MSDTTLSYSSAMLLANCQQRYYHHKIANTPHDLDFKEDYLAFNIGKAFHKVLELTNHTEDGVSNAIKAAVETFNVKEYTANIHAMILSYLEAIRPLELTCVSSELEIKTESFLGFIDAVMKDQEGNWWIVDLKTAARLDVNLKAKLIMDVQLNLYSYFAEHIATTLNLDKTKFKGARYRLVIKPTLVRKGTENYVDHVVRLRPNAKYFEMILPVEKMKSKEIFQYFNELHKESLKLRKPKAKPKKNYSFCFNYFRVCPFYQRCYGTLYSEVDKFYD